MNKAQAIREINRKELEYGSKGSWHDEFKDSAYIYAGGFPFDLTEGDLITIFEQYGQVVDINMPRDATTGKSRGFAFLMYEDQRSTVLAVDNLSGAKVLGRTLKVDHTKNFKQLERDEETGKMIESHTERLSAHPKNFITPAQDEDSDGDSVAHDDLDEEDPMADYIRQQKRRKRSRENEYDEEYYSARNESRRESSKLEYSDRSDRRIKSGSHRGESDRRPEPSRRSDYSRDDRRDYTRRREHSTDLARRSDYSSHRDRRDSDRRDRSDYESEKRYYPSKGSAYDHKEGRKREHREAYRRDEKQGPSYTTSRDQRD